MRYPFGPIDDFLGGSVGSQSEILGVTPRTILRWKRDGLRRDRAERLADLLHQHPWELWDEMRAEDVAEVERQEEERRQRKREARRRSYQRNREKVLARQAAYDAANRDVKRRYARAHYRLNRERYLEQQRERDARKRAEREAS